MPTFGPGMAGDNVATIQRWMVITARTLKINVAPNFLINGNYDAATVTLMKKIQAMMKVPQTGLWDAKTTTGANNIAKYLGSKLSALGGLPKMNSLTEDRIWIKQQFVDLYGRPPTQSELDFRTSQIQAGMTRVHWRASMEKLGAPDAVKRIWKDMYGRDPNAVELAQWSKQLAAGTTTRAAMKEYISGTLEYQTKAKEEAVAEGADDQKVVLNDLLDEYGLGTLKDWAWEQIKSGVSETRILQDLRQTDEYKARFPAMAARGSAGLPAISEADYLRYERDARQIMKRAGLPPGFYDSPDDYARLITSDLSTDELQSRINEGYTRVTNAPVEVRQAFGEMYGVDGDAALAALYVDPDHAEAALLKQTRAAEARGWGGLFGLDFSTPEAENLADINLSTDQLRQGFGQIQQNESLFKETVSDTEDLKASKEGVEAVFQTGGDGANKIDQRRRERIAALAGGGGANISQQGIGLGAAE